MVNVLKILTKYYSQTKNNGRDPFNQNLRTGKVSKKLVHLLRWTTFPVGPVWILLEWIMPNNINTVESWFLAPSVLEFTIIWAKPYFPSPHKHCNFTPDNLPIIRTTVVEEFGILLLLINYSVNLMCTALPTLSLCTSQMLSNWLTWSPGFTNLKRKHKYVSSL